jgi:hypothetical protein
MSPIFALPSIRSFRPSFLAAKPHKTLDDIEPPGKLRREDDDSALTGVTRSLQRRVLGLSVLPPLKAAVKKRLGRVDNQAGNLD